MEELRQQLAAIEHERWAHWQKWLHSQLKRIPEGLLMTPEYYKHLEYQIAADYSELSQAEQASDMEQVDRYWPLIEAYANKQVVAELEALRGIKAESAQQRIQAVMATIVDHIKELTPAEE